MLESCTRPELVTEITLQPLRRYDVDAAILFSDIVVPLRAIGVDVDIKPGVGPVVERPFRTMDDIERLRPLEPDDVPYISQAVKSLVGELGGKPLIGFAGGPFTLAAYLIEGGPSKNHDRTKAMMYGNPGLWHALMGRLAAIATAFLQVQTEAGASAVQLFDSWVGVVSPEDYRHAILPYTSRIFSALAPSGVPRIHFGVGTGELLGLLGEAGADVVGVDWRIPLDEAARRVGARVDGQSAAGTVTALQGNLDPAMLLAAGTSWSLAPGRSSSAAGSSAVTSSTWATESCLRPTPTSSPASWTSSTRSPRPPPEGVPISDPARDRLTRRDGGPARPSRR